jgi:hypothetical protein
MRKHVMASTRATDLHAMLVGHREQLCSSFHE